MAFADTKTVQAFLERSGAEALPLILIDGEIALAGRYPNRTELGRRAGIAEVAAVTSEGACCPDRRCC